MSGIATAIAEDVLGSAVEETVSFAGDLFGEISGSADVQEAAEAQAAATLQAQREAQALNVERYGKAEELLSPYIEGAGTAREQMMVELGLAPGEAGNAYMQTPGYKTMREESQRGVEQAAASGGNLYSGARMKAAGEAGGQVQSQYYTNYMNLLQNMGSPQTATNLASMGVGQGISMGQQQIGAQNVASGYMMGGAEAKQAAIADVIGGAAAVAGGAYAEGSIE